MIRPIPTAWVVWVLNAGSVNTLLHNLVSLLCVCVCVGERDRERQRQAETETDLLIMFLLSCFVSANTHLRSTNRLRPGVDEIFSSDHANDWWISS